MFDKTQNKNSGSAKVVDGALVLTLADAISPVVWRMDLDSVKEAAFEIDEKDGIFDLLLKEGSANAKGKKIASFDQKEKAMTALMQTAAALESAHSSAYASAHSAPAAQIHAQNVRTENDATKKGNGLIGLVVGLVILALLIFGLATLTPQSVTMTDSSQNAANSRSASGGSGEAGAPMSADQFLMGR